MTAPVRLAVLGDPLRYTLSPVLHLAALEWAGLPGASEALPTPLVDLGARLASLAAAGYRGVNLTHPLKQAALDHVARPSAAALRARSVNTIGFDADGGWGDTTDGPGLLDWLLASGREPAKERVVLVGAGGAARSLGAALIGAGADVAVLARRPSAAHEAWTGLDEIPVLGLEGPLAGARLDRATLVVNATPVSGDREPVDPARLPRSATALDLTYGADPPRWVVAARARGLDAHDGVGLLVAQARRSLSAWLGRDVAWEPLARAVGWAP